MDANPNEKSVILIVDHLKTHLDDLQKILQEDYHIIVAENGLHALDICRSNLRPAIVLFSIANPWMPFDEFYNLLKSSPRKKPIPIVCISKRSRAEYASKTIDMGAADCIFEPFYPSIVKMRIGNQIRMHRHEDHIKKIAQQRMNEIRIHSQKIIRQSEERYHQLISSSVDAIILYDARGRVEYLNPAFTHLFGWTFDELKGRRVPFVPESAMEKTMEAIARMSTGEKISNFQTQRLTKDGRILDISLSTASIMDDDGNVTGNVVIIRDETERRKIEKALQESEKRYNHLLKSSVDAIVLYDTEGRVEYLNPAFTRIFGWSFEELHGKNIPFVPEDCREETWAAIKRVFSGEKISSLQTRRLTKDGSVLDVSLSVATVSDDHGKITGNVVILRDETERRKMEKALEQAKIKAESASHAKSAFLANMSHEIRTPLNGIIAAGELALAESQSAIMKRYLGIIRSSAFTLLGLIDDILDFSKIEAGKLEFEIRPFELDDILHSVIQMFWNKAFEKRIEVLINIDPQVPTSLVGDPLRLQQILINLLENALKFTESGYVLVKVCCESRDTDRITLNFTVKDTGVGIAPDKLDKLFAAFTQADASTTRKYGGTGLGLAICKMLVEKMDGHIQVKSDPDKGSEFSFTIRLQSQEDRNRRRFEMPPELCKADVMVVDDSPESLRIIQEMLEMFGYTVIPVSSGKQAIEIIRHRQKENRPFQFMTLDWVMPEMDGIEVAQLIRSEKVSDAPIIMVTSFGEEKEKQHARQIGVDAFLNKPVSPSMLFNTILDLFGKTEYKQTGSPEKLTEQTSEIIERLKGARILVAEDNLTNQDIMQMILEGANIDVSVVDSGKKAVQAVSEKEFDAVLMDVQMPEMDGYEATRLIRVHEKSCQQEQSGRRLPIIAITAHAMKGDEEKCLNAGMDGYVSKPINREKLFSTLGRHIHLINAPGANNIGAAARKNVCPFPRQVDGIDIACAMERMDTDFQAFNKILSGFAQNNRKTMENIRTALKTNDIETVRIQAHSLKGSAANIQADNLMKASKALESATAGASHGDLDILTDTVEKELAVVLDSIKCLENRSARNERPVDNTRGTDHHPAELLKNLDKAIAKADPIEINNQIRFVMQHGMTEKIRRIEKYISNYEYDNARSLLKTVIDETDEISIK